MSDLRRDFEGQDKDWAKIEKMHDQESYEGSRAWADGIGVAGVTAEEARQDADLAARMMIEATRYRLERDELAAACRAYFAAPDESARWHAGQRIADILARLDAGEGKAMNLKISPEWLLRMAEQEANGIISVGGLVTRIREAEARFDAGEGARRAEAVDGEGVTELTETALTHDVERLEAKIAWLEYQRDELVAVWRDYFDSPNEEGRQAAWERGDAILDRLDAGEG